MFLASDYLLWNSFYFYADLFFRTGFRASFTAVDGCFLANVAHIQRPSSRFRQLLVILVASFRRIGKRHKPSHAERLLKWLAQEIANGHFPTVGAVYDRPFFVA
jgi:hypothetical protein